MRNDEALKSVRGDVDESLGPDFEILRVLGSGTTAYVFLAREPGLHRLVAVKVLRPSVGRSETARARFEREAHCEAGVPHPSIPTVHRIGRLESGLPYLVQEFIEGRTLRDRLEATGPVEPPEARRILADLASALAAAHTQGVIHRDVRPDNVMLRRESNQAVLMDFGIAAVRESGQDSDERLTRTGEILGDSHYASPELLRGEKVTAETDVYSFGVLGYEILTGTNPFGCGSVKDLVRGHLRDEPVDLPWVVSVDDADLGDLLKRCLRKEPARRPRAEDIRRSLLGAGTGDDRPRIGTVEGIPPVQGGRLSSFPRLAAFVAELRRRDVYQVAAMYAAVTYVVIEGAGNVLEGLAAPPWIFSTLILVVLAGFPVTLVLTWIYDITSRGVRKTKPSDGDGTGRGGRALRIVGLILSTVIAAVVGWLILG